MFFFPQVPRLFLFVIHVYTYVTDAILGGLVGFTLTASVTDVCVQADYDVCRLLYSCSLLVGF